MIYTLWKDSVNWFRRVVLTLWRAELPLERYTLLPVRADHGRKFVERRTQNEQSTS
jgi:hypothetical protein